MSQLTDQEYLRTDQYRDASNLNARSYIHQRFSTNDCPWQRWIFEQLDLPSCCHILDVGSGPGNLWLENEERLPAGWTVVLSDLSPGMLQTAKQSLGSLPHPFRYTVLDAQTLPFPDQAFDAVIANHMLYHVPHRASVLHEVYRVLRAGGRLYAATNGPDHLRELRELVTRFCPEADPGNVAHVFGLENGAAELLGHFADVICYRQQNGLVVTEAEPLIAYARSMMRRTAWENGGEALSRSVRERIAAQGAIHIQKDSGIFKATKA